MEDEPFQGIMVCLWKLFEHTVNGTKLLLFFWQFCTREERRRLSLLCSTSGKGQAPSDIVSNSLQRIKFLEAMPLSHQLL